MNIYEFQLLTHQQKCDVVFKYGTYLSGRVSRELTFNLYSLDSFYVEIGFHVPDNYLDTIGAFYNTRQLEPYLSEINLALDI